MSLEEFLSWDEGSDRFYELIEGVPIPIDDPTADHEDVADEICDLLKAHCLTQELPYVAKRSKAYSVPPFALEAKSSPVVRVFASCPHLELCRSQCLPMSHLADPKILVKLLHELGGFCIGDIPDGKGDALGSGLHEATCHADKALAWDVNNVGIGHCHDSKWARIDRKTTLVAT